MLGLSEYISSVIKSISRIILCLATSQETCENGSNIGLNGQFVPVVVSTAAVQWSRAPTSCRVLDAGMLQQSGGQIQKSHASAVVGYGTAVKFSNSGMCRKSKGFTMVLQDMLYAVISVHSVWQHQ